MKTDNRQSEFYYLRCVILFIVALTGMYLNCHAQIENLVVETYYIADANDATDTTLGRSLEEGMRSYRVFLDLAPGSRLVKLYADSAHPLIFSSTTDFYNNIDRPNSFFGYMMSKSWFDDNPTIALDSWITIGLAAQNQLGVTKDADTNGVFNEILNNTGGTASVLAGLLRNTDPQMGIPLNTADGYVPFTGTLGQWSDFGIKDMAGDDSTVFGSFNSGNEFYSENAYLMQTGGVEGDASNKILIAQLTTSGELSLELNVIIDEWNGSSYNQVKYVATGDSLQAGEFLSPYLSYPGLCGCTDPDYIEYSNIYACSDAGACQNLVRLGCMDPLACNYDPLANFNVQDLCCYPGYCGDRDLMTVCPGIINDRFGIRELHPNPVSDELTISLNGFTRSSIRYCIINSLGQLILENNLGMINGLVEIDIVISELAKGVYQLVVFSDQGSDNVTFIKGD